MSEADETALWAWFLFRSGLPTGRAKALLNDWLSQGLSLKEALSRPRAQLGIPPDEAARLHPPSALPAVTALRWDNGFAPAQDMGQGLLSLPLRLRPALLFYLGELSLLSRPMVYLAPSDLGASDRRALHEAISLLVDEPLLLGVYEASPQVPVVVEELAYSAGEAVLFLRTGTAVHTPTDMEQELIEQGRLTLVSPLPPQTGYQPAWDAVLQQVAIAAARRILLTGKAARTPAALVGLEHARQDAATVLALAEETPPPPLPPGLQVTSTPGDVLPWVDNLFLNASLGEAHEQGPEVAKPLGQEEGPPYWTSPELTELIEDELGPPLSPDEILQTLSKGGKIPDALRRRIKGEK